MPGHSPPGRPGRAPAPDDRSGRVYGGRGSGVYGAAAPTRRGPRPRSGEPRTARARTREPRGLDPREKRWRDRDRDGADSTPPPPKRPRRRSPRWAVLTVAAGAVLMLLSGTGIAGYEMLNNRYAGNVEQDDLVGGAAAVEPGQELEGPINLLLLGVDEQGEGARSDTIIVLHIPSTHDQAYLMSVPRDTWVTVPGYWDMKITDAFDVGYDNEGGWGGGAQTVASIINGLTGLRFNGAAIVNFNGFKKIIDEMGGLEFCVDTEAYSEHLILVNGEPYSVFKAQRDGTQGEQIRYEVGCQEMAGWQVLDYARQRKTLASGEGDYGRQRHQVQMLRAMAAKATSSDVTKNLATLDSLVLAAGDALIVDTNDVPLADFAFTLRNLRPNDLTMLRTNKGEFQSEQVVVDGQTISVERLTPESIEMFQAAANDTMGEFLVNNPDFVAPDGPPDGTESPAPETGQPTG